MRYLHFYLFIESSFVGDSIAREIGGLVLVKWIGWYLVSRRAVLHVGRLLVSLWLSVEGGKCLVYLLYVFFATVMYCNCVLATWLLQYLPSRVGTRVAKPLRLEVSCMPLVFVLSTRVCIVYAYCGCVILCCGCGVNAPRLPRCLWDYNGCVLHCSESCCTWLLPLCLRCASFQHSVLLRCLYASTVSEGWIAVSIACFGSCLLRFTVSYFAFALCPSLSIVYCKCVDCRLYGSHLAVAISSISCRHPSYCT
jgi:hypothetical protein